MAYCSYAVYSNLFYWVPLNKVALLEIFLKICVGFYFNFLIKRPRTYKHLTLVSNSSFTEFILWKYFIDFHPSSSRSAKSQNLSWLQSEVGLEDFEEHSTHIWTPRPTQFSGPPFFRITYLRLGNHRWLPITKWRKWKP